jgi:hypothetical protein
MQTSEFLPKGRDLCKMEQVVFILAIQSVWLMAFRKQAVIEM